MVKKLKKPLPKVSLPEVIVKPIVKKKLGKAEHATATKNAQVTVTSTVTNEVTKTNKSKKLKRKISSAVVEEMSTDEVSTAHKKQDKKISALNKPEQMSSQVKITATMEPKKKKKSKKSSSTEGQAPSNGTLASASQSIVMDIFTIKAPSEEDMKYLRYSVSKNHSCERHLFLKKDLSNDHSLIVSNIPAYLDQGMVSAFIKQFVKVPTTEFVIQRSNSVNGSLQYGQLTASVKFESPQGVKDALASCQQVGPYVASDFIEDNIASVLKSSVDLYRTIFSSPDEIQSAINEYIENNDINAKEARREAKRKLTTPDEDGWVTVTKSAKKVGKLLKLKKNEIPLMGGLDKKKKEFDFAFYTHQMKETRIKQAVELRAKFEEDKKRIALLKSSRKFKPY